MTKLTDIDYTNANHIELRAGIKDHRSLIDTLRKSVSEYREEALTFKALSEELKKQLESQGEALAASINSRDVLNQDYQQRINKHLDANATLVADIGKLQDVVEAKDQTIDALTIERDRIGLKLDETQDTLRSVQKQMGNLAIAVVEHLILNN